MSFFSWFRRRSPRRGINNPKPWSSETDKFVDLAVRSGLRNAAELREAFSAFRCEVPTPHENGIAELNDFCDHLVKGDVLTRWQCGMLFDGRYKGYFLDHFKLLRHVGFAGNWSVYDAEDTHTKRRVVVRVAPLHIRRHEDIKPYYEVDEADDTE